MRYALTVEYEGTRYGGFQYQKNAPSIQEEIEKAISRFTGESLRIKGAGRTDAGVHAKGQVVAFDSEVVQPTEVIVRALNHYLPDDIAVKEAHKVVEDFDPRRWATRRKYVYAIDCGATRSPLRRQTTYYLGQRLEVSEMAEAAELLEGVHDFSRFAGPLEDLTASTVREIFSTELREADEIVEIEVDGSAFLPHQVRRMAGALVDVGLGRLRIEDVQRLLDDENTTAIARSLPPQGLCLVSVQYDKFDKLSEGKDNGNRNEPESNTGMARRRR
jgi:tRNA pseudouridine38-40 synthase